MGGRFRSLRFKLTSFYLILFGCLQIVLWTTVDTIRSRHIRGRFDEQLARQALRLSEAVDAAAGPGEAPHVPGAIIEALSPFDTEDFAYELRFTDRDLTISSPGWGRNRLDEADSPSAATHVEGLEVATIRARERAKPQGGRQERYRQARLVRAVPGGPTYELRVAAATAPVESSIRQVRQLLIVFTTVSLVISGIVSWFVVLRSLAPLDSMARQVRSIAAGSLDEPVRVKTTDSEIEEMVTALNVMLEQLRSEFERQRRFISEVSHELKTPLSILLGEAAALNGKENRNERDVQFTRLVEQDLRDLLRTIEGFLIMAQARSGQPATFPTVVSLEEVVMSSIRRYRREAEQREVRIVPRFENSDGTHEPLVKGDFDLLKSMVENLLNNCIRYTPAGGVIDVRVIPGADQVNMVVQDTGPGISQEVLPQVFEYGVGDHRQPRYAGSAGLGLAIAKSVVSLHGGAIVARNRAAGGAEFVVQLPVAPEF